MAIKTRGELKSVFETGDQPPGPDFADLIDTMMLASDDFVVYDDSVVVHAGELVSLT